MEMKDKRKHMSRLMTSSFLFLERRKRRREV